MARPTGTVSFLFTDIEGSTKLAREFRETWEDLHARHHTILRSAIETSNGYIFQIIGDAFCAAFHTAGEAINAAIKSQIELQAENWGEAPIRVRMGIHTGKADIQENGQYLGYMTLSRVQRLMSAGNGGQVLLSLATEELVRDELPEGVLLSDRGEWQLKDLIRPMHIYQLVIPDLPGDFAPLRSTLAATLLDNEASSLLDRIVQGKLIGRERELAEANLCWQRAIAGEGQVLLISGEPGIGKTRFTHELVTQIRASGANVITGECYAEGGAPYAPVAQIIQESFSLAPTLPEKLPPYILAELLAIAPSLRSRFGNVAPNPLPGGLIEQERIYDSVGELCAHMSARTPLLLLIEDVHWADPGTLFLLRHLARRSRSSLQKNRLRLMIALTYREVELDEARVLNEVLLDLNRERLSTRVKLTRLNKERTSDMLSVMFAQPTAPEFLESIFRETEGNPFFVEEVCKDLIEAGDLTYADGRWSRSSVDEIEIPQSLRLVIQTRVGHLPAHAQEALALAAIIGREFDFETLQHSSDQHEELLIESLEAAVHAQLIEAVEGKGTTEKYSFVHALIPTTLYKGISSRRRRRAHERVANAIETLRPDDFEALAHHFAAADDAGKAVEYSRRAAERAEAVYAHDTAILHLRVALDLVELEQPELRRDLLEQVADILSLIHVGAEAIPSYQEAISLWQLTDHGSQGAIIRLYRKIIEAAARANRWADVQPFEPVLNEIKETALKLVEDRPPDVETVRLLTAISTQAWAKRAPPDWNSAERYARRAVGMAEQLNAPAEICSALSALSHVYGARGLFRERVPIELRRLALSQDSRFDDKHERVNVLIRVGQALVNVGEYAQAMSHLLEAERLAAQFKDLDQQIDCLSEQSYCLYQMDRWDQTIQIEEKWRALKKSYPHLFKLVSASCWQMSLNASVRARRGEYEQAAVLRHQSYAIMLDEWGSEDRFGRAAYH